MWRHRSAGLSAPSALQSTAVDALLPIMARTLVGLLVAVLLVACGGTTEPLSGGEGGSGQAGAEIAAGATADGDNGGWVRSGDCAEWVRVYGPWPREVSCPDGRIECDGAGDDCEVAGATDCYDASGSCVIGEWAGAESCLPVCSD